MRYILMAISLSFSPYASKTIASFPDEMGPPRAVMCPSWTNLYNAAYVESSKTFASTLNWSVSFILFLNVANFLSFFRESLSTSSSVKSMLVQVSYLKS